MAPNAKGRKMISLVSVLVGLAVLAFVLRVFARRKKRVALGIDDYLCFVANTLMMGMLIELILWCAIGGNGYHASELGPQTLQTFYKIFLSNQFTYFVLTPSVKISFVCFYRRVFTTPKFHRVTFVLNCLMAAWSAGIFLACALQCRPLRAYWDRSIDGHCFDGNLFFIVNQGFNVVMDFIILLLPIPMIWSLQRSWQDKLALNGVFAVGGFVCFASIYRIVVLFYIDPKDTTYTIYQATLWTHIEPSVSLVCTSLPMIRGLFPANKFSLDRPKRISLRHRYAVSHKSSSPKDRLWDRQNKNSIGLSGITVQTEINVVENAV